MLLNHYAVEGYSAGGMVQPTVPGTKVALNQPGFDITGAMREKAAGGLPLFSLSAMKSIEANVRRGMASLAKALDEKTTVHRAMFRNGMGWVEFIWGDEGGAIKSKGQRPGEKGLAHILEARQRKDALTQTQSIQLLSGLVQTIANGQEIRRAEIGGATRAVVALGDTEAVLVKNPGANTW